MKKKLITMLLVLSGLLLSCSHGEPGLGDPLVSGIIRNNLEVVKSELSKENYQKHHAKEYNSYEAFLKGRLNSTDLHGKTPLLWACMANYNDVKQLKKTEEGRIKIVDVLLAKGSSVSVRDHEGWDSVTWAAWSGMDQLISFLLTHGASVNTHTNRGWTPLMMGALRGYDKVVEELLKHGADKNVKNSDGKTALDIAEQSLNMHPGRKKEYERIISLLKG